MNWSAAMSVLQKTEPPANYALEVMRSADVSTVVGSLSDWYPDIVVGAESCHLTEEFYHSQTALMDAVGERAILPIVARFHDEIVGMITYEKNVDARTITCRMGVVAPAHRGTGLALFGPILLEKIGTAIGAELALYYATLKTKDQQVLAERMRFQLVGIVPAFDRDMISPGEIKRVYEALYAKVLIPSEGVVKPPEGALSFKTRKVWHALFGED